MFVLFLLYLGYVALLRAHDDPVKGGRVGGLLIMAGFVNIPIIKFSVEWWQTLHQPASVLRLAGPSIDPSMLVPLFIMAGAYAFLFMTLLLVRMEAVLMGRKLHTLEPLMGEPPPLKEAA
jgi:heme exporter protein C